MRVHIAQCLCGPARHAIVAAVAPPEETADATLETLRHGVRRLLDAGLEDRCGLCGAPASGWTYEVGLSIEYLDWETALRDIRRMEAANRISRAAVETIWQRDRN